jgi:Putative Ig domain
MDRRRARAALAKFEQGERHRPVPPRKMNAVPFRALGLNRRVVGKSPMFRLSSTALGTSCLAAVMRWTLAVLLGLMVVVPAHALQTENGITINEDLPQARRGVAYSHTIPVVSGGTAPYFFTLSGPSTLPIRLTLSASGLVSGVISCNVGNGNYGQNVTVTDSSAVPIVATFSGNNGLAINVTAGPAGTCVTLTITPSTLPALTAGSSFSQTITASGGLGPYTYAVTAGSLPAGVTLNGTTGLLSGTPTSGGAYNFTITATDAADSTGSRIYSGTVNPAILVNPATLPAGMVGTAYSQTVTASGGSGTLTLSLSGALPAGLAFNASTGVISGTPTSAGISNFTITATDANSATGSRPYSITASTPVTVDPTTLPAGTAGTAYSQTVTATGGTGPYTYAATGTLPAGLSLNASTGVISGTPSVAGSSNFTITATDSVGGTGARSYTVTVNPAVEVNPSSLPGGTVGTAYSQVVSATGGSGAPYTYGVVGSLPVGLSLNTSSGVISGTPTASGSSTFTISATDTNGAVGTRAYTLTMNAAITVNPFGLPVGTVGTPYSQNVTATGGTGSYTFSVTSGALPAGLSLSGAGLISGTPTSAGSSSVTITATDGNSATGSRSYTLTVHPVLTVSPASLPAGTVGTAYSQTIIASDGTGPYTFVVTGGALPAGLTLNAGSGVISGIPTSAGAASFTVTATDSNGATGSRAYSVTVNAAITVNPASLTTGTASTAYSQTITATGGSGSYTFSLTAGALPAGLSLNASSGAITGTPSASGTSNFTVTATDGNSATGSRAYSITINAAISVNPASLPAGTVGTAYSQTVAATGGTGSYTFSVSSGALPAGLTLNAGSGAITGTPTGAGSSSFTITATDGNSATGSRAYSVTINAAITVNPASLANGTVGSAYSQTASATGGTGSYTFSVSAGALPAGLSLASGTGVISGTPSSSGSSSFTITATDGNGATGSRAYSVSITASINVSPLSLPAATVGTPYSQTISASGGTGSFTFSVTAGALPSGLLLNAATGAITGTPSGSGSSTFTITATDSASATGARSYTLTVNPVIAVNPASLPAGTVGVAYNQTISATGGAGSFTFAVTSGALPAGLSLNVSSGAITGTPGGSGSSTFTVTATDGNGATGARSYTVMINAAVAVNPTSLANGTVGVAYSQTVSATGGSGSYTFSVSSGTLPAGLSLNTGSGAITGTPTSAGSSSFTITATDGNGATGSRAYTVSIAVGISVSPTSLAAGTVGIAYSQTISASGGTGSFTFSVTAGTLPAGLTLDSSGVLSGTPTTAATSSFTITATDSASATGSRAYSVTIGTPVTISTASLPGGTVGLAYNQTIVATGGTGAYTFSVSAGTLPAGLSLNGASGVLSGTPTTAATSAFTVTATDGNGRTGSRAFSVTIAAGIAVNPANLPAATVGTPYSQSVSATGGTGSYTFSVTAGTLPAGLALNATTGAITGTPTSATAATFTITATDSNSATGSRSYTLTVNAAITVNPSSLPAGTVAVAYSTTISAAGGNGSYTFTVTAGTLPAGLSLNSTSGTVSGTPTTAATSSFTVTATDGNGVPGARAYSITIGTALAVNPASLPGGSVGVAYNQAVSATGGTGPYTFAVTAGTLPAGLSLNGSTGVLSGTPSAAAASSFTITATDSNSATASRPYSFAINPAVTVNPASLPNGTVGAAYSQAVTASGGNGSFTYGVSAGSLPAGLSLNPSSGLLSGTPTSAATSSFTVTATDGNGVTGSRAYSVTIAAGIAVNPATLPSASVGTPYAQTITATGGTGTYTFNVTTGALPPGLALNPTTGAITGTPTTAATSSFTITATDSNGATGSRSYTFTVNAGIAVNPAALPAATVGAPYSQGLSATGGTGTYTYSVTAGSLPAGLTLNASTGVISGTPTGAATSNFTVTATDGIGATGSRAFSFVVNGAMVLNPATLPNGTAGTAYSQTVSATGGNGSYTFSVTAGSLPAGLTLNASTGALTGTPSTASSSNFTLTAVDGTGATASRAYTVTINTALSLNPPSLPNATVGTAYEPTLAATGGNGSYTYSITSGSLPAGLALNAATGVLAGMPTAAATSIFTVMVTDGLGVTASRAYTVEVAPAALTLESTTLGNGVVGNPYNQAIVVSGGVAPYAFSISSGQLPAGVSLNPATGALSGTPIAAGTFAFTIRVVDANGATGAFAQSIVVEPRPDPTADPTVRGMLAAQVSAASRFGSAQIENVGARVRMLHFGQDPCSMQFDVGTNARWERADTSVDEAKLAAAQAPEQGAKQDKRTRCDSPFAFWAGGSIDFGFLRPNSATDRSDFTTSGLTFGADARVMKGLVLGAAVGYGRDSTDVGTNESESHAQGVNATFYGSYEPIKSVYIDFLLGYGDLSFDARRFNSTAMMLGGRNGSQTFGSVGISGIVDIGRLKLAPYGRFDRVRSRLDGYTESGPGSSALSYADVTAIEDVFAAGLFASYRIPLGRASLEPNLRLEARRARGSSADQTLWYADLPTMTYVIADGSVSDTQMLGGLGLVLRMAGEASIGIDYSYTGSSGTYRSESVRALLRAPF